MTATFIHANQKYRVTTNKNGEVINLQIENDWREGGWAGVSYEYQNFEVKNMAARALRKAANQR
jgi:hypothetical protein